MRPEYNILLLVLILFTACGEEAVPKPKAMLRLDYPEPEQQLLERDCPFEFSYNTLAEVEEKGDCNLVLDYPAMNGAIYLSYKTVDGNIRELLADAQKLSYEHVVKADNITEQPFINPDDAVYGMFYEVKGDAASQAQFYATDSTRHFLTGSLYFYAKPNYDSIYPAAVYLQKDIRKIMETLTWKQRNEK